VRNDLDQVHIPDAVAQELAKLSAEIAAVKARLDAEKSARGE
jgi:hypothetical protein